MLTTLWEGKNSKTPSEAIAMYSEEESRDCIVISGSGMIPRQSAAAWVGIPVRVHHLVAFGA